MRIILLASLLLAPLAAQAHTFLVKPEQTDDQLSIAVLMTEKLFQGERLLSSSDVSLRLLSAEGQQDITLHADETAKALVGEIPALASSAIAVARSAPRYRAIEKGQQTKDPAKTLRIEAFAKALINPQGSGEAYTLRTGDRLELAPLDNPANLSSGDTLRVAVLFDGQPLANARVAAMAPQQDRLVAHTDAEGIAKLQLPAAGSWVIRSGHHIDEADARSAHYEASASLLLTID